MTQNKNLNLPKLIGHRGVKNLCPENTIESIKKAFDLGLNYIEVDVKISRDEIPILLHDDTLDRTTNGTGIAIEFDYDNLKILDAGEYFYKKKTQCIIPKLNDILNLCIERKKNINIELKPNKGFEIENVSKVFELTKNIKNIEFFFSSFDIISFIEISKIFPQSNRSFLVDDLSNQNIDDIISILLKFGANICGLNIEIISPYIIKKMKDNNLYVTVYSDENIDFNKAKECFNIGVDSIFTDDPTELSEI